MKKKIIVGIIAGMVLVGVTIVLLYLKKYDYANASVGDYIFYGNFEGKKLEWRVLAKEDDKILVIAEDAVKLLWCYEETWEDSNIRIWLNGILYYFAFNKEERSKIVENSNDTKDMIFLLSADEAEKYFTSESDRIWDVYNVFESIRVFLADGSYNDGRRPWWLRTPNKYVDIEGKIVDYSKENGGFEYYYEFYNVRPAMWISIK